MRTNIRVAIALTSFLGFITPQFAGAQNHQFALHWAGTVYTTNEVGAVVARPFSEKNIVEQVASDNGLDPSSLIFVYRVEARDTVVANKSDGSFVADVIQLQYVYTDVPAAPGPKTIRQAMLFDEAHPNAIGSAFGMQSSRQDANGNYLNYSFRGTFQYAYPETDTIYQGSFSTSKVVLNTAAQVRIAPKARVQPNLRRSRS